MAAVHESGDVSAIGKEETVSVTRLFGCVLAIVLLSASEAWTAAPKASPPVALTPAGEKLLARYSSMLDELRAEINRSLPRLDTKDKDAFIAAYTAEAKAMAAELNAMRDTATAKDKEAAAKAREAAKAALAQAQAAARQPVESVMKAVQPFLAADALDAKLAKAAVLAQATPRGLAEYAQQGQEQEARIEKLLGDARVMQEMLIADGAKDGKYGRAMEIFEAINKASSRAGAGLFRRLALAVSLEHAVPIAQSNPQASTDAPAIVDPVKRYLHYEKAFLDGELDPAFKSLSAWEYRHVVNSDAPDEILAWGREMLRNYRPDHIRTDNEGWRYSIAVKTDVKYGSQDVKNDLPTLQNYQNIIKNGGVCGRRAFFGRFILRSFGIPTVARPQRGHAALARWTPQGWVINLGAGWEWGWTDFGQGPDFVLMTQARKNEKAYLQVQRAQWLGDIFGEKRAFGFNSPPSGFWNGAALYRQRAIAAESKAVALGPLGEDIGESNESKESVPVEKTPISEADRKVVVDRNGVITIPAIALSKPTGNSAQFLAMKGFFGGVQLHCVRDLKNPQEFEYAVDVPRAGKYTLVAQVVTVQSDQKLLLKQNNAQQAVEIAVPYTVGRWESTPPVEITLVKGTNVLHFTRPAPSGGLTIKQFTLTPVK